MGELKLDTILSGLSDETIETAVAAEQAGLDCVWTRETAHDAFLSHPVIAERTAEISHGTRIALSFTRSPMVLAYMGWDLARYSNGRFILGLGTQVKGHNERRFSIKWTSPGPRLREVVESIRHIWDVFQGETDRLDYEGEHYSFSLMTDFFDPGPIEHPDIPIYIAGVNEYNIRLAGEVADGLDLHPFNTPGYTKDVIVPRVTEGADRGDRSVDDVQLSASPFLVYGVTEEEREKRLDEARKDVAFHGSTRTYHDVLEHHGWKDVGMELHELSKKGRWDEMTDLVTDEMLAAFTVEVPEDDIDGVREAVIDAYGDSIDRANVPPSYVSDAE